MRGSLHLRDFTLSAGEAKEGRRGAMLWDGDACNSRRAVARGDWVTLAKVMREAWAESGNEARAPETLNHKAILPTPRVFTLFLFLSFSDRKRIDWRAAVPQIPSIISHPRVLKPGNLLFIWIHPHVISLFLTGLFSGVVLKKKTQPSPVSFSEQGWDNENVHGSVSLSELVNNIVTAEVCRNWVVSLYVSCKPP